MKLRRLLAIQNMKKYGNIDGPIVKQMYCRDYSVKSELEDKIMKETILLANKGVDAETQKTFLNMLFEEEGVNVTKISMSNNQTPVFRSKTEKLELIKVEFFAGGKLTILCIGRRIGNSRIYSWKPYMLQNMLQK